MSLTQKEYIELKKLLEKKEKHKPLTDAELQKYEYTLEEDHYDNRLASLSDINNLWNASYAVLYDLMAINHRLIREIYYLKDELEKAKKLEDAE